MARAAHFGDGDEQQAAVTETLRGWLESTGPVRAWALAERLSLRLELVEAGLVRLEAEGQILRGRFSPDNPPEGFGWSNRRVLARIPPLATGPLTRATQPGPTP